MLFACAPLLLFPNAAPTARPPYPALTNDATPAATVAAVATAAACPSWTPARVAKARELLLHFWRQLVLALTIVIMLCYDFGSIVLA